VLASLGGVPLTSTGALVAALALGVREALAGRRRERPPIVHEADDPWPRSGEAVELHAEPDRPDDSWVVIRPWLLRPAPSTD
jgi:hypothetical protein